MKIIPSKVQLITEKIGACANWKPPVIHKDIPHGDMPGDKVVIGECHISKANVIFPVLLENLKNIKSSKAILAVCGCSGVGKSETASLLSYYFNEAGIGSYTMSGDNYPHRIPKYNDAERKRIFRCGAIREMVKEDIFSQEHFEIIHNLQLEGMDARSANIEKYPWYESYLSGGRAALKTYLGTEHETNFAEVNTILDAFKDGKDAIWLKRMGRGDTELWYEKVDFSDIQILVMEWTHGNNDLIHGVDIPILLNSTPQETLLHRQARNRDGATDSPFTMLILEIEQELLASQAHKAKIIVSKSGKILSFAQYKSSMEQGR